MGRRCACEGARGSGGGERGRDGTINMRAKKGRSAWEISSYI